MVYHRLLFGHLDHADVVKKIGNTVCVSLPCFLDACPRCVARFLAISIGSMDCNSVPISNELFDVPDRYSVLISDFGIIISHMFNIGIAEHVLRPVAPFAFWKLADLDEGVWRKPLSNVLSQFWT